MPDPDPISVIDLFAGPGGLGEGFAGCQDERGVPPFRVALSIEKEAVAHDTLRLRSFFRQFAGRTVPEQYYDHLRGDLSCEELYDRFPAEAAAGREAWHAELGRTPDDETDNRIREALGTLDEPWVLHRWAALSGLFAGRPQPHRRHHPEDHSVSLLFQ
ncbi:MAG: hypothetical protein KY476_01875 [Planctomycetes bacterium]|nr:hypothetical protein [Planctomycetota bacterium]